MKPDAFDRTCSWAERSFSIRRLRETLFEPWLSTWDLYFGLPIVAVSIRGGPVWACWILATVWAIGHLWARRRERRDDRRRLERSGK